MVNTILVGETPRQRLVRGYANSIYLFGSRTFASVSTTYYTEIKQYAATNFTLQQIDAAYANIWITDQEYQDTIALMQPPVI